MRFTFKLWAISFGLIVALSAARAQVSQIDPTSMIQWQLASGSGTPTATCTQNGNYTAFPYGAQWGQTYLDQTSGGGYYVCTPQGWVSTSSVPGGPWLPLAGGTLTGALLGPSICSDFQPVINVLCYGADGTLAKSGTGSYTSGSTTVTVSGAGFTSIMATNHWGVTLFDSLPFGSPYGSPTTITATACNYPAAPVFPSSTAPVTITATNTFRSTEHVLISGATGNCTALNGRVLTVDNGSLSGSAFNANISDLVTFGGADSFTGVRTMDQIGTIVSVTDATHIVVSVAPTVTTTNPKVGWWPDLTVPIQNALNAGSNATYFAGGTVGSRVAQLFFPQGEYHVTGALYQQHVQVQGIPGSAGTRIVWDGPNHGTIPVEPVNAPTWPGIAHTYGTMWDRQSIGPGNSAMQGIEFYADSPFFVPDYMVEWDQKVDQMTFVNQVHVQGALKAGMAVGVPLANGQTIGGVTANMHWTQNRWDEICGDGTYIYIPPGSARMSIDIGDSTLDTGSKTEVAQGCTFRSVWAVDAGDATNTGIPAIIHTRDMRVESQSATQFDTSDGPAGWFHFVNQNKSTFSYVTPIFDLDDITFNTLGTSSTYILSSGNTNGFFCPRGTVTNPRWGSSMAGLIGTSTTPANYACATSSIAQTSINETGAFAAGTGWIGTLPIGSGDPSTTPWVGSLPHNKMPNTMFAFGAMDYTLGTGVTVSTTGCDGQGNPCLSITGTGSAFAGGTTTTVTTAIPVTANKAYIFGATPDCTNVTSGIISMFVTDGVTTVYASCSGAGAGPNVVSNTYTPTTSTITVGFSYRASTATNGQVVTISAPFLYAGTTAVPYQPNFPSLTDATIPAAALPVASGSTKGIGTGDNTTIVCTAGVCSTSGSVNVVASIDRTGLTANITSTLLYAVPSNAAGWYRATCYAVVTTAATTSTLPACVITWTDKETGVSTNGTFSSTSTGNTVGATNSAAQNRNSGTVYAAASTNINYGTGAGYASNPANTMTYSLHIKVEYLGP